MNTKTNFSFLARTATLVRAAGSRVAMTLLLLLVTTTTAWADADLIIRSTADWNTFANNVSNGTDNYAGKVVMLAADISVSTMAGDDRNNWFYGTFDGCGHTLTINLTGGYAGTAPFRRIYNATIKNLNVTGTITTTYGMAGSIAFVTNGTTHISNCLSTVTITGNGKNTDGGLVSCNNGELHFTNCAFKGKMLGNDSGCGGFVGWNNIKVVYNSCLFAPLQVTMSTNSSATFNRDASDATSTFNSCYYTQAFGTVQGTSASGMSNETLVSNLGSGWEIRNGNVVPKKPLTYLAYHTAIHSFAELTVDNPTIVDASTTTMGAADTETWYVVSSNVTVSNRIEARGTVHLILCDGKTLTANGGIGVTAGNSLYIYSQSSGTGQLTADATGLNGSAGIGGGSIGNITIHGGNITATGGDWSAGIGGGTNGGGGSITIYGGNVEGTGWRVNNNGNAVGIGRGSSGGPVAIQADGLKLQYYENGWQNVTYSQRAWALEKVRVKFSPCTAHSYSDGRCSHCGRLEWYTVTYNGNGNTSGSVPTDNTHYATNGTGKVTILGNTGNLAITGYSFAGWNTAADGSGTSYAPGTTFTIYDNITLYAQWTPITYTVRFHKNDGGEDEYTDQAFTYNVAQTLTANAFTREGYDFMGWSMTTDNAVAYTDGQSVSNLANVQGTVFNLYAKWAIPYTITYNLDGGTVTTANPTTYYELSNDITLVNPIKTGYVFAGWTGTGLTEPTKTVTIASGSTGDRAYTATWKLVTYLAYNTATGKFETRTAPNNTMTITSSTTTMGAANTVTWYMVSSNVTISSRITVNGTVHLILCDGATLTASQCVNVEYNKGSLNIYAQSGGTGALTAYSPNDVSHAGIGSYEGANGDITIHGGVISATGNSYCAGIGAGNGSWIKHGGNITIYGGTISATGGYLAAGIGGAYNGNGGTVTILGGTVIATAGTEAPEAIGRGNTGSNSGTLTLGYLKVYSSTDATDPVASGSRISTCRGSYVKLMPCTEHSYSDGRCTYCDKYQWYTVTYNGNGNTGGSVPTDETHYANDGTGTVTVLGNTGNLVRTGYSFSGWNTKADGSGTTYAAGATFAINGNTMLYAKWTFNQLTLANNDDNDDIIGTAAGNGMYYEVTLAGRTLYRDGDWNTLCLPFNVNNFTGTPLEGATVKTLASTNFADGTLTMNFSDVGGDLQSPTIEAGKPYIVKWTDEARNELEANLVIHSETEWNTFASNVNNGTESYAGKVVKLAADISISTMVGSGSSSNYDAAKKFCGTFDGCGHTLNVSISENQDGVAPFRFVAGATFKNLTISGSVTNGSSGKETAGMVAYICDQTTISNCVVSASVTCNKSGDCSNGGFVARIQSGEVTINNCLFSGELLGLSTHSGGFVGWRNNTNIPLTFNNCLFAPSQITMGTSGSCTFNRASNDKSIQNNCYYTTTFGSAQGTETTNTGTALKNQLGDGWEVIGDDVMPKMKSTISNIVNPVFTDVTISSTTANVSTTYADFIGSYAPFNDNSLMLDAHNPSGDAMHAAISINETTRDGYTFGGWYTDAGTTTPVTTIPFAADGTVALYGKWTPITYTVRLHKNDGGEDEYTDQGFTYDVAQTLASGFTRTDYYLTGWAEAPNGSVVYTDGESVVNLATEQGTVINLYAQWTKSCILFAEGRTNQWMTWCDDDVWNVGATPIKVYTVSSISGATVILTEVANGIVPANTPVLIQRTDNSTLAISVPFSAEGTAGSGIATSEGTGCTLYGNPTDAAITTSSYFAAGRSYVLYGDKFLLVDTNDGIAAHRCMLTLATPATARSLDIVIAGNAAEISATLNDKGEMINDTWYTLDGRKLNGKPAKKGVYIYNGKKTVIK